MAEPLGQKEIFKDYYSPLSAPGSETSWVHEKPWLSSSLESPGLYQGAESAPQSARDPHPVASIRTKLAQFPSKATDYTRVRKACRNPHVIRTRPPRYAQS